MYMQMTQCERTIIYPEAMTSFGGVNKIKSMKRTSVQVKLRASLCTATYEAVSNRGGVEPLLSWEYVHGNQEG